MLAVLTVFNVVEAAYVGQPVRPGSQRLARMAPPVLAALPPTHGDVIVRGIDFGGLELAAGFTLWAERHGVRARVDKLAGPGFGAHRVHNKAPVRATLTFVQDDVVDTYFQSPDQRLLFYEGDRPLAQRSSLVAQVRRLDAEYDAAADRQDELLPREGGHQQETRARVRRVRAASPLVRVGGELPAEFADFRREAVGDSFRPIGALARLGELLTNDAQSSDVADGLFEQLAGNQNGFAAFS